MESQIEYKTLNLLNEEMESFSKKQIETVLDLLLTGNTVPFIARYRKEVTGSLDEVQIREIEERYHYLSQLEKRKEDVLANIEEQGKLTEQLAKKIKDATKMQRVEDLYRPYKQKRRTKATIAKEKGLEPLANWILSFPKGNIELEANKYIDVEKELLTTGEVLAGVHEIVAEFVSDKPEYREWIRTFTEKTGQFAATVKSEEDDEKKVYEMYYSYSEPIRSIVSHRILALNRGEKEGILSLSIEVDEEKIHSFIFQNEVSNSTNDEATMLVKEAIRDSYKRFIGPAIEREIRSTLTEKAEDHAIQLFGDNLRNLLLQSPLKNKTILGFDPAYRTGCKLAVIDAIGKFQDVSLIYPHPPAPTSKRASAKEDLQKLLRKHQVDIVAIGNGTASRESESFVADALKDMDEKIAYVIVNEAGASVYSASPEARREFPDLQVEERSAISIARRLQDPLAELVKIDPKSIGVGQYQHDVSQKKLTDQLDFVIETVVNQVGVNVNTASSALLQHISGLNKTTAQNIVLYREENGSFEKRTELKKVARLGPKAYEQSIGFLRIPGGKNPLDNTGIHPETYKETEKILKMAKVNKNELGTEEAREKLLSLYLNELEKELEIGTETIKDSVSALIKPGRDMREDMPAPLLRTDVLTMGDLKTGMQLEGTVRNVVDFGAFVDVGVKQDGLVHISKLSQSFIKHPSKVVSVGDIVTVWVDSVDLHKGRIALTRINPNENHG
ncbi:Tex-like N-terminal domain-containing protein [Lacticigenium naphthae]|uniref:Tex family protein n=1 Tax=Lacticigenium naphthae TaxID=515351 RepID=UPI0003F5B281